jgi:transcriptional regulatory protein LevR
LFIVSANGKKAVEKEFLCLFVVLWERKREKKRPHIIVSFQGTTTADYGTLI